MGAEPSAAAGSVVESRELASAELIPGAGRGFRLVYRTTGQGGQPEVSGGLLYLPVGVPPAGGWPVVSWGHGTSGITRGCAPSQQHGKVGPIDETRDLSLFLAAGYAVAATDYIGLGAPGYHEYLAGRAAGHSMIDIVRAGRSLTPDLSASYAVSGLSQGGHGALFAGSMAADYAPELNLRGVLAYAPTSNIEHLLSWFGPGTPVLPLINGVMTNGVMLIAGLAHARPDIGVGDYLTERGREVVRIAETSDDCGDSIQRNVRGRPSGLLLAKPLSDPVFDAALRDYVTVPTTGHLVPIYLAQGVLDDIMPMPAATLLQQQLTDAGANSQLEIYPTATHLNIVEVATADGLAFLGQTLGAGR